MSLRASATAVPDRRNRHKQSLSDAGRDAGPDDGRDDGVPLRDQITYRIAVLSNMTSRHGARTFVKRFGITVPEWRVMRAMGELDTLTVGKIADISQLDKALISRAISSLVERGYVIKSIDPSDRRSVRVAITAAGQDLYEKMFAISQRRQRWLQSSLSPEEFSTFLRVMDKLEALIGDSKAPPY